MDTKPTSFAHHRHPFSRKNKDESTDPMDYEMPPMPDIGAAVQTITVWECVSESSHPILTLPHTSYQWSLERKRTKKRSPAPAIVDYV